MKTEEIALAQQRVAAAQEALVEAIRSLIEAQALPDDPVALLPAPADLRITEWYGENTVTIGIGVENVPGLMVEYIGFNDLNGPQEWTSLGINAVENEAGSKAMLSLTPSASRSIRIRAHADGHEAAEMMVVSDENGSCVINS